MKGPGLLLPLKIPISGILVLGAQEVMAVCPESPTEDDVTQYLDE
jgi:hypothetical protein